MCDKLNPYVVRRSPLSSDFNGGTAFACTLDQSYRKDGSCWPMQAASEAQQILATRATTTSALATTHHDGSWVVMRISAARTAEEVLNAGWSL